MTPRPALCINLSIHFTYNRELKIMNFEEARQKLEKYGQLHVLDYYGELTD